MVIEPFTEEDRPVPAAAGGGGGGKDGGGGKRPQPPSGMRREIYDYPPPGVLSPKSHTGTSE